MIFEIFKAVLSRALLELCNTLSDIKISEILMILRFQCDGLLYYSRSMCNFTLMQGISFREEKKRLFPV